MSCSASAATSDLYNYENFDKFVYDGYIDISVLDSGGESHDYMKLTSGFDKFNIDPGFTFSGFSFKICDSSVINSNFSYSDDIHLSHKIILNFPSGSEYFFDEATFGIISIRFFYVDQYGSDSFSLISGEDDFSLSGVVQDDQIIFNLSLDLSCSLFGDGDSVGSITGISYSFTECFYDVLSVEVVPQYGSLDGAIGEYIYYCVGNSQFIPDYTPVTEFNFFEQSEMVVLSGIKWALTGVENMTSSTVILSLQN